MLKNKTKVNQYGTTNIDQNKYQAHYKLIIKDKHVVEFLFLNLKTRGRNTFIAKPHLDQEHLDRIKANYEERAKASTYVEYKKEYATDSIATKQLYSNINYVNSVNTPYTTYYQTKTESVVHLEDIKISISVQTVWSLISP